MSTETHTSILPAAESAATRINESLEIRAVDGVQQIVCVHCDHRICDASQAFEEHLAHYEGPPSDGGPMNWATPEDFVDAQVVFRQSYCPGCFTALITRILPVDHPPLRDRVVPRAIAER